MAGDQPQDFSKWDPGQTSPELNARELARLQAYLCSHKPPRLGLNQLNSNLDFPDNHEPIRREIERFKRLYEVCKYNETLRDLRTDIEPSITLSEELVSPTSDRSADGPERNSANTSRLFPKGDEGLTEDQIALVQLLDQKRSTRRSQRNIAREITNGNAPEANSLLAQLRALRRKGRVVF